MSKALIITPPFWDPVCPPLGMASLKAFAESNGHLVNILDFNTYNSVFQIQNEYFNEVIAQFPYMKSWNIARNGTEMLSIHQMVYMFHENKNFYGEMITEILNMDGRTSGDFHDNLDVNRFDEIFDKLFYNVKEILDRYIHKGLDVVGCHLNNSTWASTLYILRYVKKKYPKIRTVVGGPGPVMGIISNPKEIELFMEKNNFIDHFIAGEGEHGFLNILNNEFYFKPIIFNSSDEKLEMHDLPPPDFDGLQLDRYLEMSVSASRGCPFECSFCAETKFWDGFKTNKASNVYKQMNHLERKYKRSSFYICDSLSNHIITPLTKLIHENKKDYHLDCYLRADKICTDEKRTKVWREGGLYRARLGLESASQRILDDMVKMTTPEKMEGSLAALSKHGILTSTLWIVGYPGETESEFESSLSFLERNHKNIYQADAWVFQYSPVGLAGSDEFEKKSNSKPRFSDEINKILAVSPYGLDDGLKTAEKFDRLERFTNKMKELKIPNPYSIADTIKAQKRFTDLHTDCGWDPVKSMNKSDA